MSVEGSGTSAGGSGAAANEQRFSAD